MNQLTSTKAQIRVVLVDDHAVVRAGIRTFLEQSGRIVVLAEGSNGQQALALVAQFQPDVIVLDIQMPVMNGIEATRMLRAKNSVVGILILTAYDDRPYVQALLQAGANGYVLKTADPKELIRAVEEVYAGKTVIDELLRDPYQSHVPLQKVIEDAILSRREMEVLRQVAEGLTNKAISVQLKISSRTVQNHLANIFKKMECESRTEMVAKAIRLNLIESQFDQNKPSVS